jgi:hypothetical protein
MPETAMDKEGSTSGSKDDIRPARQVTGVQSEAVAHGMQ